MRAYGYDILPIQRRYANNKPHRHTTTRLRNSRRNKQSTDPPGLFHFSYANQVRNFNQPNAQLHFDELQNWRLAAMQLPKSDMLSAVGRRLRCEGKNELSRQQHATRCSPHKVLNLPLLCYAGFQETKPKATQFTNQLELDARPVA
ncbi:unnamed protein product [Ceratitis capitata]|uniref:(Mediterranean fruit fly) hypothetical protein n=1 Tax=Ceratitis capitata TaxID=7213 RepID=A0A811V762_CERCA|nr:unnamed protein product [Ceratitis capitata]